MIPTTTPVYPGEGISEFLKLGNSLYDVVSHFNKLNHQLRISYSSQDYLNNPILITLPNLGLRLVFENLKQCLIMIEVLNFEYMQFTYNNQALNEIMYTEVANTNEPIMTYSYEKTTKYPTLKQIYNKTIGPTYPGKLNLANQTYLLSYPGISFKFKIKLTDLMNKLRALNDESAILSKLINWDKSSDIFAESMAIFNGKNYEEFHNLYLKGASKPAKLGDYTSLAFDKVTINLKKGKVKFASRKKTNVSSDNGANERGDFYIKIGETTQQEILNVLGPPDDYFNKFDSRLLIHSHLMSLNSSNSKTTGGSDNFDNSIYKFHNYFRYGLDFLYALNHNSSNRNTGILTKIVVHNGGITESLDFMRWNKCNWEMVTGYQPIKNDNFSGHNKLNSSMYFNQFPPEFFEEIKQHSSSDNSLLRPVLLNRSESEFVDDDLEFIQPEEVTSSDSINTSRSNESNLSNNLKTWGQSKLYGCHRCIWEVIESNGCVSCLTIY